MSEDRFAPRRPKKTPVRPPRRNILIDLTVRVLRGCIDQLEGIVARLESSSSPENYPGRKQKKRSLRYQLSRILSPVRRILPPPVNQLLPDPILAIAIAAILIAVFSQIAKQTPRSELPVEIVQTQPSEPTPKESFTEKSPQNIPEKRQILEPKPEDKTEPLSPKIEPETFSETPPIEKETNPDIVEENSPDIETETEIPSQAEPPPENPDRLPILIAATAASEPVNFISPPGLEMTSRPYLIGTIKDKMGLATSKISPEIVLEVRANFSASLLQVELNESWYELSGSKQNKIAEILYNQAQNFDFTRLEMMDAQGKPIGRSAVIGSNMIILNRTRSAG